MVRASHGTIWERVAPMCCPPTVTHHESYSPLHVHDPFAARLPLHRRCRPCEIVKTPRSTPGPWLAHSTSLHWPAVIKKKKKEWKKKLEFCLFIWVFSVSAKIQSPFSYLVRSVAAASQLLTSVCFLLLLAKWFWSRPNLGVFTPHFP